MSEKIPCPACGTEHASNEAACTVCGYSFTPQVAVAPEKCPRCGSGTHPGFEFCQVCGLQLRSRRPRPTTRGMNVHELQSEPHAASPGAVVAGPSQPTPSQISTAAPVEGNHLRPVAADMRQAAQALGDMHDDMAPTELGAGATNNPHANPSPYGGAPVHGQQHHAPVHPAAAPHPAALPSQPHAYSPASAPHQAPPLAPPYPGSAPHPASAPQPQAPVQPHVQQPYQAPVSAPAPHAAPAQAPYPPPTPASYGPPAQPSPLQPPQPHVAPQQIAPGQAQHGYAPAHAQYTPSTTPGHEATAHAAQHTQGLRVVSVGRDGTEGEAYSLGRGPLEIGRQGDLAFPSDPFITPRHAKLEDQNGSVQITDLGSRNGIYIRIASPEPVYPGDMFLLGHHLLRLENLPANMGESPPDAMGVRGFGTPLQPAWGKISVVGVGDVPADIYFLRGNMVVFGRESGDVLFPRDPFMSRQHARLRMELHGGGMRVLLEDLGSANGTYLRMRGHATLGDADMFRVGDQIFRVRR